MRDSGNLFPEIKIKPLLKKRHKGRDALALNHLDPNMLISEQSVTARYLTQNLYSKGSIRRKEKVY